MYARLAVDAPAPDLVIYLQAPVDVLLERIERRGIRYEQHIERSYLEKLQEAYARFFLRLRRLAAADRERGAGRLRRQRGATTRCCWREIRGMRRGRQYYNRG